MKKVYPVVLTPLDDGWYTVYVPDLDVNTQGTDMADAIYMARDLIGMCGIDMLDKGKALPEATNISAIKLKAEADDIITLIDVDFDEYRRQNDLRMVKKNCTVPAWLSHEAEKQGLNFSALLQTALKKELNVKSPADIVK